MRLPSPTRPLVAIVPGLLLALVTVLAACSSASAGGVRKASAAEAVPLLAARTVIDVRTPSEYAGGHLAGAINIDVDGSTFAKQIAALDKTAAYVVYCHSGRRSGIAASQMSSAGFKDVIDAGALEALAAAGAPMQ